MAPDNPHNQNLDSPAWLEQSGERIELNTAFAIGRSPKCEFVIPDTKVSRRHALIQYHSSHDSWLISDLGSKNGVYHRGVRITRPVPLKAGDTFSIGGVEFVFHEKDTEIINEFTTASGEETLIDINTSPCWILLADIKDSTRLSQNMPQHELSSKIRIWAGECEDIIKPSRGVINEYLGDGILAFWRDRSGTVELICDLLARFHTMESASGLKFRAILHYGILQIGGGVSSGLEKLAGAELNYIFRMEKAAGESGEKISVTQAAMEPLRTKITFRSLGEFELKDFSDQHALYAPLFE